MKLDGQRDRRTDRQIVHYTAAAEWDPDQFYFQFYFQLIQGSGGISLSSNDHDVLLSW